MSFIEMYLLALGGVLIHFLKMWLQAEKRKEKFLSRPTILLLTLNLLSSALLIYIGPTLPPELVVMSPLTCVLMGIFGSSMLTGLVNARRPKNANDEQTFLFSEDDDTGGSNPPPNKPKPPTPPSGQP